MIFTQPAWFLLLLPLAACFLVWPLPSRLQTTLRAGVLLFLVAAMAGPVLLLPQQAGTVVVVADRSRSLPVNHEQASREIIDLVQKAMGPEDRLGVVSFGEQAFIDRPPDSGKFPGFSHDVGGEGSVLADGLDRALALIPRGMPGRVLVLSDGRWTGRDPSSEMFRAAARAIPIDVRSLERSTAGDVAIESFEGPNTVSQGEAYLMTAWVRCPVGQEVSYRLLRNRTIIAEGKREFPPGVSRLPFRDLVEADAPNGVRIYRLELARDAGDPIPENNIARHLVTIHGARPVLVISSSENSRLADTLKAGGVQVRKARPTDVSWTLEELGGHAGVVLENVPADAIGPSGMKLLAAWVKELGGGLMMTGGKSSYAPGGYFKSPLEGILPISMELRNEHRKLALGMVVVMDRSGSMAMDAGKGRRKMDLANLAAAEVVNLLGPMDEFGVIAVDSSPHVVVPLGPVNDKGGTRNRILRIESEGGGIFIGEALKAAYAEVSKSKSATRHIILFADAQDSEEPADYIDTLNLCEKAQITCSVVGMGMPSDCDSDLLRDIATRGKGRVFFTENVEDLPRIFVQDTFVVARSTFIDGKVEVDTTGNLFSLTGQSGGFAGGAFPAVGGYNLCYLRPGSMQGLITRDENKAPLLSWWQAGIGRSLAYTGEVDGQFTGEFGPWPGAGGALTAMARWVAGQEDSAAIQDLVTQEIRRGNLVVKLHLDPDRWRDPFSQPPKVTILRGRVGGDPVRDELTMTWSATDQLLAEIPLRGEETVLGTVELPGGKRFSLAPAILPYSPEYRPAGSGEGARVRETLMKTTGGVERIDLASIWKDLPHTPRPWDAAWLALAAGLLFLLLEVLERRTGALSFGWVRVTGGRPLAVAAAQATGLAEVFSPPADATAEAGPSALGGAMSAARSGAGERIEIASGTGTAATPPSPVPTPSSPAKAASPDDRPVSSADQLGLLDALKKVRRRRD